MIKRLFAVLLLTLLTGGIMFLLVSNSRKPLDIKHGFNRTFNNNKVKLLASAIVPHILFVAGNSDSVIYFHSDSPSFITYADTGLHQLQTIPLPLDSVKAGMANGFSIYVHYPDAFVYAYNMARIFRYNIPAKRLTQTHTPGSYTGAVQISDSSFMLRYFTGNDTDQGFCLLNLYTATYHTNSLLTETDLSSSGNLLYDIHNAQCVYVRQFSNNILLFDTSLQQLTPAHTIDTFTQSRGEYISHNKTGSKDTLYKPKGDRMLINYLSQVYDGKLYVNSLLKADNETMATDQRETTIDVYEARSGQYLESFYVPLGNMKRLNSFRVMGKRLVVTYNDRISLYALP
ncbi:hypothetical protein [Chitinophaga pinensis]|uniref:Uncharacterized protein n=1 Tax=Chitinophaga pinensis (strain ATCC 43595 / DSM 2588 / LMG 13176 / NBRC 15968 / NCIMB 11800 / UQM 2034) TaxID=485918 RepID=A0A979G2W4_CHIPD|nr:hypothetical protein [Chitinophaga pinensis]ACU59760.1 hypothetical protein Cpin_2269 [Chitinophaga pinensis DSM 2588]